MIECGTTPVSACQRLSHPPACTMPSGGVEIESVRIVFDDDRLKGCPEIWHIPFFFLNYWFQADGFFLGMFFKG
ncbi:hypothetical protein MSKU15_0226 [Komagataeibacter diospyri]|nr:hypothetical protein MSKU15_0226 [Komagataeibacter diospyri]